MAAATCTQCGKALAPESAFCTQCGARVAPPTPAGLGLSTAAPGGTTAAVAAPTPMPTAVPIAPPMRPRICVNCKTQMSPMGAISFRAGSWPSGPGAPAGGWATGPETMQPFSLYYCQQCGKFDLYYAGT